MSRLAEVEAFVLVIRGGGFTAAARELGRSKSYVSKKLAALEARVGVRLAERTSRRVWLTEAGERFYGVCDRVLREVERAERLARGEPGAAVLEIVVAPEVEAMPGRLREPLGRFLAAALYRGEPVRLVGAAAEIIATQESGGA